LWDDFNGNIAISMFINDVSYSELNPLQNVYFGISIV